jgi:hypothetical protein
MTDLRDQLADFDAAARRPTPICHPGRKHKARRLCAGCYEHHMRNGTLDAYPRIRKPDAEIIAAYRRLRSQGHSFRYVAYALGMTFDGLNKAYYRAVAAGALTPDRRSAV